MPELISFSDNDHWRFGWGKGLFNFDDQQQPMWVTFGPCRRPPKSFDQEMAATVKRIADNHAKPIYVAMSGGIDSELIARIMVQEKIDFIPTIVQFDHDYNKLDIAYAFEFCKTHQLTPEIIKLDILAFFEDTIHTPYIVTNCAHLMQMHIMRHVHRLGGIAIIGVGEQRYEKNDGQVRVPVPLERIAVTHFMQAEQVQGVSAFYCYTPELMLSLLREVKAVGFDYMSQFAHNMKENLYHKFWPNLPPRPKLSGFEGVSLARHTAQQNLMKKLQTNYGAAIKNKYAIPIDTLENQLSGTMPLPL